MKNAFVLDHHGPIRPMDKYDAPRFIADKSPVGFHVMIKQAGSACNLDCTYCFYLSKARLQGGPGSRSMSDETLEKFVQRYIRDVTADEVVFTWQGGEPTLQGLALFRKAMGGYAGGVSLYALDGELFYEYSALLLRRNRIEVGALPVGEVTIVMEMRTPMERAAPAELKFWINGEEAATGTVERTVPAVFTASETFDVGMDTSSPVANDYLDRAPFEFEGKLQRLHFENLAPRAAIPVIPDD